ncbi:alpha-ketoacid dehydrogenase subunit beta [Alicyclobacillus macrosporangiidus]|uniref:Pyruvate dehydrogenase E1 component beta subunit n=1 Tax=Alicyclobacillus macrosporangiidus TaxID=392015 RepID=A0A1I7L437_9BACL|nr:alpha-ketoacid dehydrogenase subunit beta [Alicyclobacillus macrosporangiidus]SFV04471.1 pyruvate dehydrogenase E1 component beta subunit [Alicyclobacillus macrosporangiidus]
MAGRTMIQAIQDAIATALARDPRVMVLGEDVGKNGGVFRATEGLQERFGEGRVIDTPLAESGIVGTAVGLALAGMRPIDEIQFLGFIYETMDQLASQAARIRFRTQGRCTVPLVVRAPFGGGVRTPELHSDSLEALFLHTPGLKVVMPSNPYDAKGLLLAAVEDPDPVLVLEPMRLYRLGRMEVPDGFYTVPIGPARLAREGEDVTIVAWGPTVPIALEAAEAAAAEGVSCEVLDLRTVSPFDAAALTQSVEKTGRAVVVHEAVRSGGVGAEVLAAIHDGAFYSLLAPVERVTGFDTPYPPPAVEDLWLPTPARVLAAVRRVMQA